MILNIHPIGDGLWFWYAVDFRAGKHLYSDTHLPLQPLFVILTAAGQRLFGDGWLASKVLAVLQLVVFVVLLMRIAARGTWKDWQKALLVCAVFHLALVASYFRFDDYHVTGYCFELLCVLVLLRLPAASVSSGQAIRCALLLGIFCGLSISNRLNDGGMLLAGCFVCLLVILPRARIASVTTLCGVAALVLAGVISLTGDSFRSWASDSIVRAASIKGGGGSVVTSVFLFPFTMIRTFISDRTEVASLLLLLSIIAVCVWATSRDRLGERRVRQPLVWLVVILLLPGFAYLARREQPNQAFGFVGAPMLYGLTLWAIWRLIQHWRGHAVDGWQIEYVLLAIPALQVVSGSVTSGRSVLENYPALAVALLLLPILFAREFTRSWYKVAFLAFCGTIFIAGLVGKASRPYYWHHFQDRSFFKDRVWYNNPERGPMYIDREQLRLMSSFCDTIHQNPSPELLSLPYPYPNYFCGVHPWHGFVQTWYDTSGKERIDELVAQLTQSPPQFIAYQRGLDTMSSHEVAFMNGRKLPHRALDELIVRRVTQGQWRIVHRQIFEGADWMLIQTRP